MTLLRLSDLSTAETSQIGLSYIDMEKLIIEIKQKLGIIEVYKSHNFRVFYEGNKSALKCHMISNITKVIDYFFP